MDETEEYARVMSQATEIIRKWEYKGGDFVYRWDKSEARVIYFNKHHGDPPEKYTTLQFATPLPRQDQLQKMWKEENDERHPVFSAFLYALYHWADKNIPYLMRVNARTGEQLQLTFIMSAIHGKVWNGEDWVSA